MKAVGLDLASSMYDMYDAIEDASQACINDHSHLLGTFFIG